MIIGHRGTKGKIMENTLDSILHAIELGVDGIEFDVRRCYSGEIILFHDNTLDRLAFKDRFYFDETKGKNINSLHWYHLYNTVLIDSLGRMYNIPKLIDILRHPKVYKSNVLINIELKDLVSHKHLVQMIEELIEDGLYEPERFMISSYHIEPLIYIKEFKDECDKLLLSKYNLLKIGIIYYENVNIDIINIHSKIVTHIILEINNVNKTLLSHIDKLRLKVFIYTVNTQNKYIDLVDGIITDKPSLFLNL